MTAQRPSRPTILCVEDDPQLLDELHRELSADYEVLPALNAAEALRMLAAHNTVAAIISDTRMPGMDGASFLARTRTFAPAAGRILLTDHADLASAIAAVNEAQILRFLSKPFQSAELHAAVEAALEHHRHSSIENTGLMRAITEV